MFRGLFPTGTAIIAEANSQPECTRQNSDGSSISPDTPDAPSEFLTDSGATLVEASQAYSQGFFAAAIEICQKVSLTLLK